MGEPQTNELLVVLIQASEWLHVAYLRVSQGRLQRRVEKRPHFAVLLGRIHPLHHHW